MLNKLALAGAFALGLSACASTGAVTVGVANDVAAALAVACPALATAQNSHFVLNANQKAAAATLALACPPNPPPTSATVAAADLVSAYAMLRPLLK